VALNPRIWAPLAVVFAVLNVGAMIVFRHDPGHSMIHLALAAGGVWWSSRLRATQRASTLEGAQMSDVLELREEVEVLRHEMLELEERVDFAERMLAQARELDRIPEHRPGQG
jgi:hypothetical protein